MNQSFNAIWEDYVFKVAALTVSSASPANQDRLVSLASDASLSIGLEVEINPFSQTETAEISSQSVLGELEGQWKTALNEPLSPQRIFLEQKCEILRQCSLVKYRFPNR